MTTQFTNNLALPEPQTADPSSQNTWGILLNTAAQITDACIAAVESVDVSGSANVVLTFNPGTVDETCAAHFNLTGTLTGDVCVLWPNGRDRMFSVTNQATGAFVLALGVNNGSGLPAGTTQTIAPGATGQFFSNGTDILQRTSGGISKVVQQVIPASGTYTPTAGMQYCTVRMVGGGAGGFTAASVFPGGGGGAGEYAEGTFTAAQVGASQSITIGAGGAASSDGGDTSFGSLLTAKGGKTPTTGGGGFVGIGGLGGTGGSGTGLHSPGGDGTAAALIVPATSGLVAYGGTGGAGAFGGGGRGGAGLTDNGHAGEAYGSGGGGNGIQSNTFSTAGAGAGGLVIVTEYC